MAVCCKVCKHIVAKAIVTHLEAMGPLSDVHHGFCQLHSCETQLLHFIDELAWSMCEGDQVDVAVTNFSNALGVVRQEKLLVMS